MIPLPRGFQTILPGQQESVAISLFFDLVFQPFRYASSHLLIFSCISILYDPVLLLQGVHLLTPAVHCRSFTPCLSLIRVPGGLAARERECAIVDHRTISKPTVFN
jgi:hypothetical protein